VFSIRYTIIISKNLFLISLLIYEKFFTIPNLFKIFSNQIYHNIL